MEKQSLLSAVKHWGVLVRGTGATPMQGGEPPPCTVQGTNLLLFFMLSLFFVMLSKPLTFWTN